MSAAGYILAINLLVAGLFAGVFAWIAVHEKERPAARWFALTYLLGMANFAFEWMVAAVANPRFVVFSAFAVSVAALCVYVVGLAHKYGQRVPWLLMGFLFAASLPLNLMIYDMPRASFLRVLLYQLPYAAIEAIAAWLVFRVANRRSLDTLLAWLLAASAVHFLSKPFIAVIYGLGSRPQDYVNSIYGLISQSMGAVLIVAGGMLTAMILLRDMLAEATEKSETDPLSGLLNRRGFEERALRIARSMERTNMSASIVLCDIDHFKAINDGYGHPIGDRVIAAFGAILKEAAGEVNLGARIGGEEFVVLLRGANLPAARLFAEGIRHRLMAATLDGPPDDLRITASFGVAELHPGEHVSQTLRRADRALYEAKGNGRNCVRVWEPALEARTTQKMSSRPGQS